MPEPDTIVAIVLAAGSAQRFGADKLMHPLTLEAVTRPLAAHSLQPWLQAFEVVTVVVRPESETLRHTIEQALGTADAGRIHWIVCAEASLGMAASLASGIRANPDASGWLIGLADMPALPVTAIAGVKNAMAAGTALAATCRNGRRGHPVGFAAPYRDELLALRGDNGARQLLERDADRLSMIEIDDDGIFTDIDTLEDVSNLNK